MNDEQFERYMQAYNERTQALHSISYSLDGIDAAIRESYNGQGTSAFWGLSQAMFMMVDADRNGQGLVIKKAKE